MEKDIQVDNKQNSENFTKGVIFMIISATGFALMNIFLRLAGDIPVMQKTFYRNLLSVSVSLIILMISLKKNPRKLIHQKSDIVWLFIRSFVGTLGIITQFYSMENLPVAVASVIHKFAPFFTIVLAMIFLKESVSKVQVMGIFIAIVGILVLIRPQSNVMKLSSLPLIVGVIGALIEASAHIMIRYLTKRKIDGQLMVCFFSGFAVLFTSIWVFNNHVPMNKIQMIYVILIGVTGLIGQYGVTFAYKFSSVNKISIFDYTTVIVTTFLGMTVLDQIPSFLDVVGILIVFVALFIIFIYNRNKEIKENQKL